MRQKHLVRGRMSKSRLYPFFEEVGDTSHLVLVNIDTRVLGQAERTHVEWILWYPMTDLKAIRAASC